MLDWDLVRYFLAVARCGSTLTASRALKQSQPTVARRIASLEAALGQTLFERRQAGYRLSEDGAALMEIAEGLERAAGAFCDAAGARSRQLSGTVKLTCGEMLANYHLAPMLTAFRASFPDIRVELVVSEAVLDIAGGEADVAVRGVDPGSAVGGGAGLVARKLLDVPWIAYASRTYIAERGAPRSAAEMAGHDLVGADGGLASLAAYRWFEKNAADATVVARANTLPGLIANVRGGMGVGVVSAGFIDDIPDVAPCFRLPEALSGQVWLVTHERVRNLRRVRALLDFLTAYIGTRTRRSDSGAERP